MISIPLTNQVNFYSKQLSGDFLRLYNASVENLARGILKTSVTFNSEINEETQSRITSTLEGVFCGCPELFYVNQSPAISFSGNECTIEFTNKYENENVMSLWNKLDAEINRIVAIIRAIPRPFDQIHRLNQYLCARVKPRTESAQRFGDAYGALILKEARCEGYSKAAKLILNRLGMESIIACGNARNGDSMVAHTWNIIAYNNNYYHFDFTWNACNYRYGIPGQEYMFLDDELAGKEHFKKYNYPHCPDATKTFWARNNGFVKYHSDLCRIKVIPFKNNYLAIANLETPPTDEDLERNIHYWMRDELAGYNYATSLSYSYNERLNLLLFYFIND